MKRSMLALLVLALGDWPGYVVKPEANAVSVRVGDTIRVRVDAFFLKFSNMVFRPLTFQSSDRRTIDVKGTMPLPTTSYIRITGLQPGRAQALFLWSDESIRGNVEVTVVCGKEPAVQTAEPQQTTKIGTPVTLRALTRIAERTTFTWYHGLVGDMSAPIAASGPEIAFATDEPGQHHVWVMATTPCSSSTAQFAIEAVAPKRRTARH